ncbi:hypothetical protein FA13DRAFT_1733361 [Coprinellus micaceus]|uniref:Uncharacterized protein n=1 Tax=Coprinellus micaceus TaxID=71717 RepID=A0A4Y7T9V2_COPMI|nr:hypothetical protein FA13DRAFT_1733361 [Coprinellus micaceus]
MSLCFRKSNAIRRLRDSFDSNRVPVHLLTSPPRTCPYHQLDAPLPNRPDERPPRQSIRKNM